MSIEAFNLIATTLDEIGSFQKRVEESKNKKSVKTLRKLWALRSISARLSRVRELLQIEKYDLVFIGKVGVGKTTAICHLFNLLLEENTIHNIDNERIEIPSIKEILATGSGRTTICEVVIRTSETTSLEIEPYSEQEVKESIEIFCTYIWKKVNPKNEEVSDISEHELEGADYLPAELKRAIRNLVGLKEVTQKRTQVDEAADLANQYTNYKDFKDEVISRAQLSSRTITRIEPSPESRKTLLSQTKWIKEKFIKLNLCDLSGVSIPRRIYIYLSPEILDLSKYPFSSIIDTRGIDEGKDREDLSRYIRDNNSTVCIFTEKFPDAPTNVVGIIGKYLTPESQDIDTKLAILVMPRQGEPTKVMGQNGQVESREEGLRVRHNQIKDSFEGHNINFLDDNILFYDSLRFFDDETRNLKPHYSQSHVDQDKKRVLEELSAIVSRRRDKLSQEAFSLAELAKKIQYGELSEEDERRIQNLKKTIEHCQQTNFLFNFEEDYIQSLKSYHVMVFRAINNRCGIYEYREISIYFDAKSLAEDLVRKRFGDSKSQIVGAIRNTEEGSSELSGLKPVLEVLRKQIDEYYEQMLIQAGEEIYDLLINKKFAPLNDFNPFWAQIQARWGQGKGYRNDVLQKYRGQLNTVDSFIGDKTVDSFIGDKAQELWREFMKKILDFFADE